MLIHSPRRKVSPPPLDFFLADCGIEQVQTFKFLGVFINDTLTGDDHVNHIVTVGTVDVNLLKGSSFLVSPSVSP